MRKDRQVVPIDVGQGLQRQLDPHVPGHVHECAAGPKRAVQSREPGARGGHRAVQVGLHEMPVALGRFVQ